MIPARGPQTMFFANLGRPSSVCVTTAPHRSAATSIDGSSGGQRGARKQFFGVFLG